MFAKVSVCQHANGITKGPKVVTVKPWVQNTGLQKENHNTGLQKFNHSCNGGYSDYFKTELVLSLFYLSIFVVTFRKVIITLNPIVNLLDIY